MTKSDAQIRFEDSLRQSQKPWPPRLRQVREEGPRWRLWLRFRAVFAWREVCDTGVYSYMQNELTGERRVLQIGGGYQPLDRAWLNRERDYVGQPPSFEPPAPHRFTSTIAPLGAGLMDPD